MFENEISSTSAPERARSLALDQQESVLTIREDFFHGLLTEWSRPVEDIDRIMGQDDGFFVPDFVTNRKEQPSAIYLNDVPRGLLAASVTPEQSVGVPQGLRWVYSIMQAGDWLRFGVMIQSAPQALMRYELYHENVLSVERIWDRSCDYQLRDASGLLLEWRFCEPDFYKEFVIRERFLIMARHMHFRLGKVLRPLLDEISDLHALYGDTWMNHHADGVPIIPIGSEESDSDSSREEVSSSRFQSQSSLSPSDYPRPHDPPRTAFSYEKGEPNLSDLPEFMEEDFSGRNRALFAHDFRSMDSFERSDERPDFLENNGDMDLAPAPNFESRSGERAAHRENTSDAGHQSTLDVGRSSRKEGE
jgi:hypothetical protein